ncbi:MAG: aspartyl protease family protein [Euryarchaeota archaeon]|nr:aspartyl protease family protein [Euryarchaeota archaeon]
MRINGFFRNDAGYVNALLFSEELEISETIEFLIDTGASRTTLLDKNVIYLGIEYGKLRKSEQDMSGIGGSVETYVIDDSVLLFGEYSIKTPVFVLKHPLEEMMNEEERIKILRFPSILGRDVISRLRLIFDRVKGELLLTREEKEEVAKQRKIETT